VTGIAGVAATAAGVAATATALAFYARIEAPWFVLGWVALVPWLAALDRARSARAAAAVAALMAVAFVLGVFGWFAAAIASYTGVSRPVALLLLLAAAPLLELQLVTFALARHVLRRARMPAWATVVGGAAAWVATEWTTGKLFGDTLGHGLYPSAWMRQAADVAGVPGLTLMLLAGNECVLAAVRARGDVRRAAVPAAVGATLVAALLGYGAARSAQLASAGPDEAPLTAGIVQADIAQYDRMRAFLGTYDAVRTILDVHLGLSASLLRTRGIDVLLWPETVYPTTFGSPKSEAGAAFDREIASFVADAGVPLVFGSYDLHGADEFNAAVFLAPSRTDRPEFETYRKASLFPLTERVPAILDSPTVRRWLPWLGTWKPGTGGDVVTLTLRDGRRIPVAPLICYDVLDPRYAARAVRRGAALIVTLSNDSWFGDGPGARMHLIGAAFRSIETRRPQLRATNTGISAVIDATGAIVGTIGVGRRDTLVATVTPVRDAWTLAAAWGDWLGPTALAASTLLVVGALLRLRSVR
jgi:apolipoprotein N-acyltransferase